MPSLNLNKTAIMLSSKAVGLACVGGSAKASGGLVLTGLWQAPPLSPLAVPNSLCWGARPPFFPLISPRQMQEACLDPLGRCGGELALLLCGQALEVQE